MPGIRQVEKGVVICLNWMFRQRGYRASLKDKFSTVFGMTGVRIEGCFVHPNTFRIEIKNIDEINFPKETVKEFWKRLYPQ